MPSCLSSAHILSCLPKISQPPSPLHIWNYKKGTNVVVCMWTSELQFCTNHLLMAHFYFDFMENKNNKWTFEAKELLLFICFNSGWNHRAFLRSNFFVSSEKPSGRFRSTNIASWWFLGFLHLQGLGRLRLLWPSGSLEKTFFGGIFRSSLWMCPTHAIEV